MMNVGVGDIITLSAFAFKCYKICKESSEQFRRIATEVSSLRSTLDEVKEAIEENQPLSPTRQERLNEGIRECEICLRDLEELLNGYESMYTQRQRVYDRLRFGVKDIADIRSRIISHTTTLGVLNQAITKYVDRALLYCCLTPINTN
jgi:chromosome segregation ATPase